MTPQPHDFLCLAPGAALVHDGAPPPWVEAHLAASRTVTVRRARPSGTLLPVGIRGGVRSERAAAWLAPEHVAGRIRPEDLAARHAWLEPGRRRVPPLDALDAAAALVEPLGLPWGPVGGAGFELATGVPCLQAASDLDLLVRAPQPIARGDALDLLRALAALPVRIDVQLETPAGAVALAELAGGAAQVMLRTLDGPRLVADPWVTP